jgi:hypothetical protein
MLVCLLSAFPLGFCTRFFKNLNLRLMYGIIFGILLQYQMYELRMLHLSIATINTYLFIHFFGRKYSSFWVMAFNIGHLSYLHISNMFLKYGEWKLGIETLYMMSICKFSSVAFNYEDGGKDEKEVKSSYHQSKYLLKL